MTSSMSLSKLYDEIVTKVKVDRSSREIEDISSAVEEMLERLVSGGIEMNHYSIQRDKITLKFQNVDIQPCGSMAEHASLWKSTRRQFRENTFLEYDYLAVLQNEDNEVEIEGGGCQGCRWIYIGDREFWSGDRKLWPGGGILLARDFNLDFLKALYSRIHSRCSCRVDPVYTSLEDDRHHDSKQFDNATPTVLYCRMHGSVCSCRVDPVYTSFEDDRHHDSKQFDNATPTVLYCRMHGSVCSCRVDPDDTSSEDDRHDSRPCTMCTVVRDTGYLQIAKIPDISPLNVKHSETCSLVFYWTSHTDSLLAPNVESLQPTEKIKRLVIRVDLLPAFKFPNNRDEDQCGIERLIITKECPNCIGPSFMVSYCKHELNAISYVSDQHRQSYIIIKFLYGQFIYWTEDRYINSFHAKVAFLTHCQTCTDEKKDCTTCVTEILESLVEAYRSKSLRLPEFHPVENLRFDRFPDDNIKAFQIPILSLLHVLSQLKCHNENDQCNSQYGPSHTKGLIKRTCRMLCGQARPGIIDVDGKLDALNLESRKTVLSIKRKQRR